MKSWQVAAVIIIVAVAASGGTYFAVTTTTGPRELEKVVVAFDWIPTGRYGVFYPAVEKGYYEQEGLQVTFVRGYGSGDTATKVGAGTLTFGLADATGVITARGNGVPVKIIGVVYPRFNHAWFFTDPNIRSPADFHGKKLICSAGEITDFFDFTFRKMGGDPSKVQFSTIAPGQQQVMITQLQGGQVDAMCEGVEALGQIQASIPDKQVRFFKALDYGLVVPGESLIASDKTITGNSDLVRRFVRATYRGIDDAIRNPDEAARLFVKYWPEVSNDIAKVNMDQYVKFIFPGFGDRTGLQRGVMELEMAQQTHDVLVEAGRTKAYNVQDVFTNQFLQ